ncbi:MAG: hypothetical protein ACI8ZB_000802 [Desulforhopalus sp.]|jgi:hypothetical protein
MQTLSSKYTFFYKFVFILIWVVGFGIGAREVIFFSVEYDLRWTQYAVTWAVIAIFIFFATGSIKTVIMDKKKRVLIVSNYFKTHDISFDEVEDIDGSSLLSPKLIWFTLKNPSPFGRKINFLPAVRPQRSIGKHPMVIDLRREFKLDK